MNNYGILFDLDGTLVDSLADICGNLNDVRRAYGLTPRPNDELVRHIGRGAEYLIAGSFPELPVSEHPTLLIRYRDAYLAQPFQGGRLYPGVAETLQALKGRGLRLGVATNKSSSAAEKTLEYYLPGFRFEIINGPDRVSERKPHGAHLLETMAPLGLVPERTWYVGDDPVDRLAAQAAGVRFFAAGYGFGGVEAPPEQTLRSFPELLEKLVPFGL